MQTYSGTTLAGKTAMLWLCSSLLVLPSSGAGIHSERNRRHRLRHVFNQSRRAGPHLRQILKLEVAISPEFRSSLVTFAPSPPSRPPFAAENDYNDLYERARKLNEMQLRGRKLGAKYYDEKDGLREKRSTKFTSLMPQSVCNSTASWGQRLTAVDRDGNEVIVLQEIAINDLIVNQYFYETVCVSETTCHGINHRKFLSICRNTPVYVYAYVINRQGEEGWSHVRINGACNCALFLKDDVLKDFRKYRRLHLLGDVLD